MAKWTLRNHCKRVYWLARNGDKRAEADIRAYIDSLRKKRNRNRWRQKLATTKGKMTNRIKLLACAAVTLTALTGCKNITPQTASSLTTLAVYEVAKNNPKITAYMRAVQPSACNMASTSGATIEDVVGVISNATDATVEEKAGVNIILSIFQTATAPLGTNTAAQAPYLKAVFCEGWAGGLASVPRTIRGENAPPSAALAPRPNGKWILVK